MKTPRVVGIILGLAWILAGCSKEPATATAQSAAPDNAMTRYAQSLADDQKHAQVVEDRANQAIAKENDQIKQATNQIGNN